MDYGGSGNVAAGNNKELLKITFNIAPGVSGQTPINFGDFPTVKSVSNRSAQDLPTTYEQGFVKFLGPTAATATVGGRITRASGKAVSNVTLTLTDTNGLTRNARTNLLGYYQFSEIPTGETYVLNVSTKLYSGKPQVITVVDNLANLDFIF